jgi:hypothetical protein
MVHRKVYHPADSAESTVKGVFEQLAGDRAAMVQRHGAIQAIAKAVNSHSDSIHTVEGRLEEQTRMRLDDHRLNIGALNHVRTGVEDLTRNSMKLAEHVDFQDRATYAAIEAKLVDIKNKVDEMVPQIVEDKLASIQGTLDAIKATEQEMKAYLIDL